MKLCVTHCTKDKRDGVLPPCLLYDSLRIDCFTAYCKERGLKWAILSAKYGLFFPEEKGEKYDVTFKKPEEGYWLGIQVVENGKGLCRNQSDMRLAGLAETVADQISQRSVDKIVYYYGDDPQKPRPEGYLALLHYVIDKCDTTHSWDELLECTANHGTVHVTKQLDFEQS